MTRTQGIAVRRDGRGPTGPAGPAGLMGPAGAAGPVSRGRPGAASLRRFCRRLEGQFTRAEPREHAYAYLCSLLSQTTGTPTGWADGRNRLLTTTRWDEDQVRDMVRDVVVEHLGSPDAVLVLAEEGFVKKGDHSAGVERQYCASTGRADNYQIGLFLLYADSPGTVSVIDRELLLPSSWREGTPRCERAGIPPGLHRGDRGEPAAAMVERALDAGVPARWVVTDTPGFGDSPRLRAALEARRMPYVLSSAESASFGRTAGIDGFERWRVARWDGGSYVCFAPRGTECGALREAMGRAALAAPCLAAARREAALDRYAVRQWRAWYRHMTLAMFAHAFLTVGRGGQLWQRGTGRTHPVRGGTVGASAYALPFTDASFLAGLAGVRGVGAAARRSDPARLRGLAAGGGPVAHTELADG
ncbi:transposase [Streptomyces sp. N2-109]|uniref:Transposase n=1 Tax=Streptomyces gossypii TaxID=2883101 RepID=A0ABT2JZD2_9ACTN|nr:transposase [Streptomyces gossypii]MCT2593267.1 transposase [Streptomyces gossypii]